MIKLEIEAKNAAEMLATLDFLTLGLKQLAPVDQPKEEPLAKAPRKRRKMKTHAFLGTGKYPKTATEKKIVKRGRPSKYKYQFLCNKCGKQYGSNDIKSKYCSRKCAAQHRWANHSRH